MSLRYLLLAWLLAAPAAAADEVPGEPPRAPTTALTLGERRVILVRPIEDAFVVPETAVEVARLGRQTLVLTPRKAGPAELRVVFEGREWSMPLRVSGGRFQRAIAREERPVQDLKAEDFEDKKPGAVAASPAPPAAPRVRAVPAAARDAERVIARVTPGDERDAPRAPTSPPSPPAVDRAVQDAARERVKQAAHRAAEQVIEQAGARPEAPATPKPLPPPSTWGAFASRTDLGGGSPAPSATALPEDVRVWGDPDAQPEPEVPEAAEPAPAPRRMVAIPRPRDEDVPSGAVPLLSFRPPARPAPRGTVGSWHGARVLDEDGEADEDEEADSPPPARRAPRERVPEPAVIGPWSSMPPPIDDDVRPPRLTGILRTAQGPVALLDGLPAGVGESAAGYTVDRVDPDRVVLTRGGKNLEIRLNGR